MPNYESYFKPSRPVKILIQLSEKCLFEGIAIIRSLNGNQMELSLAEDGYEHLVAVQEGAAVTIVADTGYSVSRCTGRLESLPCSSLLHIALTGRVSERQQREHFRFDVRVPIIYSVPEDQTFLGVKNRWREVREQLAAATLPEMNSCSEGFMLVKWHEVGNILPEHVNLSGGGVRFKMPESLEPGTLINLQLFLPLVPPRVICAVAEVLRCNELQLFWHSGVFYSTAMRFLCIDEKDRESIISFIFSEQRRTLREYHEKGLFDRL